MCDFDAENEQDLDTHISENHNNEKDIEISEIKLEIFAIVNFENDVLQARKDIIEKLCKQKEVEKVDKVFVDKMESFMDVDNVRWNSIDVFLTTKEKQKVWKDSNFRQNIFSKCFLWENFRNHDGLNTRQNMQRRKEEQRQLEMSTRGYHF